LAPWLSRFACRGRWLASLQDFAVARLPDHRWAFHLNDADTSWRRNLSVRIGSGCGRTLGVLYERDDYAQIAFKVIRWKPQRR